MKKENWEILLHDYLASVQNKKFNWAKWNCCNFIDGYISHITDTKFIPSEITWKNKKTALEAIRELGDTFLEAVEGVCKQKKYPIVQKSFISIGDIVFFKEKEHLMGIYDGNSIKAVSDDGLVKKDLSTVIKAWRVV